MDLLSKVLQIVLILLNLQHRHHLRVFFHHQHLQQRLDNQLLYLVLNYLVKQQNNRHL
jgi:hypothetical protein